MASEEVLDIESLIQPISDDQPGGKDVRLDSSPTSPYFTIKQARNSARAAERNSLFDEEAAAEAQDKWRPILELAPRILREQSKDLEVVTWYIEALIRYYGFAGLRDGFKLARELVERYWDHLYPEPDEDGLETKVAPLTGLNGEGGEGTLLAPIRNVKITDEGSANAYSYWQYQQAGDLEKIADPDQREQRAATLGFNLKAIRNLVAENTAGFYVDLKEDLEACLAHFRALNELLDQHCGHDAPPSSNIRNLLDEVLSAVIFLAKDKLASAAASPTSALTPTHTTAPAAAGENPSGGAAHSGVEIAGGVIRTRQDALRQLSQIAEFFRQTEPHSPLANSIDRVVRWGRMSLQDLLLELLPDRSARSTFSQLTGVNLEPGSAPDAPPADTEKTEDAPRW